MEVSLLRSVLQSVEGVRNLVKGDQELHVKLKNGLDAIKCELALLSAEVKKTMAESNQGAKPPEWILQLQDLAYDIEDFLDQRGRDPKSSAPVRLVQAAMVTDPRPTHIQCIDDFKERIKSIRSSRGSLPTPSYPADQSSVTITSGPSTTPMGGTSVADRSKPPSPNNAPVGMEQPKRDLTELLLAAENKRKVISIVGCSGVGKTTLAWQVYNDSRVQQRFPHRAWVEVQPSLKDAGELLYCVLWQLRGDNPPQQKPESGWDAGSLTTELKNFLRDERYLVIINGVRENDANNWAVIGRALPENDKGSRIVVTTSIRSVATGFSSGRYLYCMRGLDRTHSEDLFWTKLGREDSKDRLPALADELETFFHMCDGLPLLLVDAADSLSCHGRALTHEQCRHLVDDLRSHLAGENPAFGKTWTSLVQCYDSLPDYRHKVCMLSVSAFPKGHRINRKSLIRRWIAEGLVVQDAQEKVASEHLNKLRDLSIIEPASPDHVNYYSKMKRCQVHGAMLEFLVQQAVSWNFIMLNKEKEVVRNQEAGCSARRLSVHGAAGEIERRGIDLSRMRSLTVCNKNSRMSLESCKLLRVLDMEGCTWLSNDHLCVICGLLYLKYLSLRDTGVSELPKAMKDLQCLETLDVRDTSVAKLPLQVLMLPQLLHLFGKFELPHQLGDAKKASELENFFSEQSKLQTVSGFKIVSNRGFKLLLLSLKMLRKVKIWCEVPPSSPPPPRASPLHRWFRNRQNRRINIISADNLSTDLVAPLQMRFVGSNALDSLSVDFGGGVCQNFLASALNDGYTVSSLKVRGLMEGLPQSQALRSVRHVRELHLCNTGLRIDVLSRLQRLPCLVYLKLLQEGDNDFWNGGIFVVKADGFPSLHQLCFTGPRLPEIYFRLTPVCPLLSLQLICPEPNDDRIGVTGIEGLRHLNEVILHPNASPRKMEAWTKVANKHTNRSYVKNQQHNDGA